MVFRINKWASENQWFELPAGKKYTVTLSWSRTPGGLLEGPRDRKFVLSTDLPVLTRAKLLECYGEGERHLGWEYVSLGPGGRADDYAKPEPRERDPKYSCIHARKSGGLIIRTASSL